MFPMTKGWDLASLSVIVGDAEIPREISALRQHKQMVLVTSYEGMGERDGTREEAPRSPLAQRHNTMNARVAFAAGAVHEHNVHRATAAIRHTYTVRRSDRPLKRNENQTAALLRARIVQLCSKP